MYLQYNYRFSKQNHVVVKCHNSGEMKYRFNGNCKATSNWM